MQHPVTYDNFLSFMYREDLRILFLRWMMQVTSPQLRAGYHEALRQALEYNACYWLFDLRGRGPVASEDEDWVANSFFPAAGAHFSCPNYFAYLVAPSHQQHFQASDKGRILQTTGNLIQFKIFTAENEAIDWLQQSQE